MLTVSCPSPWGNLCLEASSRGLERVGWASQGVTRDDVCDGAGADGTAAVLVEIQRQLQAWFMNGSPMTIETGLFAPARTTLEARLRFALLQVRPGQTFSYGQLAQTLGRPGAARQVGQMLARNPLLLCVPCHRITGAGGRLRGYAGGVERQASILAWERAHST